MRILDRYIIKSVFSIFFGCLLTFFSLYIVVDIFGHLEEILRQRVNLNMLRQYYFSYLPIIFVQVTPIAGLISTLYTFGRLNRDNEIIAMRSAGMSIYQITRGVIIFGALLSVCVFWVNDRLLPRSTAAAEKIKIQIESGVQKHQNKEHEAINNLSMYGLKNRLFFVRKFTLATSTMEDIVILEHDEKQNIIKKVDAKKGIYKDGGWKFYQCITNNYDENGQIKQEPLYNQEEIMAISETPHDFLTQGQHPEVMSMVQLEDYIWKLSKSGATTVIRNLKVDLYQRYTTPLTSLIIILLGIPSSLKMKKRATGLSSLGISIMVGFLYYVISAVSIALGKVGLLFPILAASVSPIIGLIISLYLISTLT